MLWSTIEGRVNLADLAKVSCANASPKNGYSSCTYLGGTNRCFDIEAHKDGQKFLISVKTRNHTTDKNDLKKDGYNLFYNKTKTGDPDAEVRMALKIAHDHNAIPMWVTVTADAAQQKILHVCCGLVADLLNKKLIPMSPGDILKHRKLGEQNVFDPRIKAAWSNVKRKRPSPLGGPFPFASPPA